MPILGTSTTGALSGATRSSDERFTVKLRLVACLLTCLTSVTLLPTTTEMRAVTVPATPLVIWKANGELMAAGVSA